MGAAAVSAEVATEAAAQQTTRLILIEGGAEAAAGTGVAVGAEAGSAGLSPQ